MREIKLVKRKLGVKERNYIEYCSKFYFLNNAGFPTAEQAAFELKYTIAEINYFLTNRNVIEALERRGLPWKQAGVEAQLTPIQIATAMITTNFADERPMAEKLESIGVNPQQYYAWLDLPEYNKFVNRLADKTLQNIRPEAVTEFAKLVRKGDFRAIQYYFEVTGQFKQEESVNVQVVIQRLIEIVQKHVSKLPNGNEVLAQIASDMLGTAPVAARSAEVKFDNTGRSNMLTSRVIDD